MSRGRRPSRRAKTPPSRASRPQRGRRALPFCESGGREKVFACLAPFRLSNRSPFVVRRGAETGFCEAAACRIPVVTLTRMTRSVIVSAVRTPFGRLGGGLKDYEATALGAHAIKAALERIGLDPNEVEYVIMGQVLQGGAGQAPARQAAIGAGLPIEVPADTINKVCASSIRAIEIADSMVRAGDHDVIVAGGMESMSNAPYVLKKARFGYKLGDGTLIDLMTHDGLTSTFDKRHMVEQASFVSRELGISREEQDLWALRSHERAVKAIDQGLFEPEIAPVGDVAVDEGPRRDTT